MTDVSWMLELWLPSTLKGRSSPPTAQTESFTFLPMDALSWGSKPAACEGTPHLTPQAAW